ncbi:MAG: hypothetical protein IVW57_19805, partial [Ktedonobacterales bacterium]|nr:hypothetical protein [Ktedonobacterales bacterium]
MAQPSGAVSTARACRVGPVPLAEGDHLPRLGDVDGLAQLRAGAQRPAQVTVADRSGCGVDISGGGCAALPGTVWQVAVIPA